MALRVMKALGEHSSPGKGVLGTLRQFRTSSRLMVEGAKSGGVSGPGTAAPSEGAKDMNIGDRETLTEGSESPRDVAETLKEHKDAGKSDDAEVLKGKPAEKPEGQVRTGVSGQNP